MQKLVDAKLRSSTVCFFATDLAEAPLQRLALTLRGHRYLPIMGEVTLPLAGQLDQPALQL